MANIKKTMLYRKNKKKLGTNFKRAGPLAENEAVTPPKPPPVGNINEAFKASLDTSSKR